MTGAARGRFAVYTSSLDLERMPDAVKSNPLILSLLKPQDAEIISVNQVSLEDTIIAHLITFQFGLFKYME